MFPAFVRKDVWTAGMTLWQKELANCIHDPETLAGFVSIDVATVRNVTERFPLRITPYYLKLISTPGDPIWKQCIPDRQELDDLQSPDPLEETRLSPVPGLIHRYPDRVVLLVSATCAVYCRFCMRKRRIGCSESNPNDVELTHAIDYIAENPAIKDVILSGGDPLMLPDDTLASILSRLRKIPHLDIIRIGTRMPVTLPSRITANLCRLLKEFHPLYINTHFNHPREITHESAQACNRLADAGFPLGNQTVLLKDVNDDPAVMKLLMEQLLKIRVKPYYIHQMDLVCGTAHFQTSVTSGIRIMQALRGYSSGLATPYYVIDLPGGKGKVPILPECSRREGEYLILRNYLGEEVKYYDPLR
jgi:lysine 2,3-aminomutase